MSSGWRKRNLERARATERRWRLTGKQAAYKRSWRKNRQEREAKRPYPADDRCELCGKVEMLKRLVKRLSFDHDHETGKFRGWLCSHCNTGLRKFGDDPVLLRRAADYIENARLLS